MLVLFLTFLLVGMMTQTLKLRRKNILIISTKLLSGWVGNLSRCHIQSLLVLYMLSIQYLIFLGCADYSHLQLLVELIRRGQLMLIIRLLLDFESINPQNHFSGNSKIDFHFYSFLLSLFALSINYFPFASNQLSEISSLQFCA